MTDPTDGGQSYGSSHQISFLQLKSFSAIKFGFSPMHVSFELSIKSYKNKTLLGLLTPYFCRNGLKVKQKILFLKKQTYPH
jgi:hypothetical protein